MSNVSAGPIQYADANPSETRLSVFQRLSRLKIDHRRDFERWASTEDVSDFTRFRNKYKDPTTEKMWTAWEASRTTVRFDELFDAVRVCAVFDESFRLPALNAGTEEFQMNVEEKFARLMKRMSILALLILKDQDKSPSLENEECLPSQLQ